MKNQQFEKAKIYYKKILKAQPSHYASAFNLSIISFKNQNIDEALKYLDKAKSLNPFDMRIDQMRSSALLIKKDPEAQDAITALIQKKPDDISAHKKMGIYFLENNKPTDAAAELTIVRNLSPSDIEGRLLLSLAFAYNHDYIQAFEKIKDIESSLNSNSDYKKYFEILREVKDKPSDNLDPIFKSLPKQLTEQTALSDLNNISFIEEYANPEVTQRIVDEMVKDEAYSTTMGPSSPIKTANARPLDLRATLTETMEIYKRSPKATSPINGGNLTNNLKISGSSTEHIDFAGEMEWFYNRWDNSQIDYFKISTIKNNDYRIDVGKFSADNFPDLVSYPTVEEGIRVTKEFNKPEFKANTDSIISADSGNINLGEFYRQNYIDERFFKNTEVSVILGKTLEPISLNSRKEKNENTLETSGQFEQWTQAYRAITQVTDIFEIGSSLAITSDRKDSADVSSSTNPISSTASGIDMGLNLLDDRLVTDAEIAWSNYDENLTDLTNKHKKDHAWIWKTNYIPIDPLSFSYEQKYIGRDFKVEGAYQTEDKITHDLNFQYRPTELRVWFPQNFTINFKPEETNLDGAGSTHKYYRTFQNVIEFKLPDDAKCTFDYKYYKENDKCNCSSYITRTLKTSFDWIFKPLNLAFKPSYTFERKDDKVPSPTDEKTKEYALALENNSFKNLTIKYSIEQEVKTYRGTTNKSYHQYIDSVELKYLILPLIDVTVKASRDFKDPSETNKTDIGAYDISLNYQTKDGDTKVSFEYERKNNIYKPWSDTSAYRQDYFRIKYTQNF